MAVGFFAGPTPDTDTNNTSSSDLGGVTTGTPAADTDTNRSNIEGESGQVTYETNRYNAIVVFRNDDLQPAPYWMDELRALNRVFVEEDVPVTHGVIANETVTDGSPNATLCTYLRGLRERHPRQFEFALHGFDHADRMATAGRDASSELAQIAGRSEFAGVPYETQLRLLRRGTDMVERCVGVRPTVFVPPFETYDRTTVRALNRLDYIAVGSHRWFTSQYYDQERTAMDADRLVHLSAQTTYWNYSSTGARDLSAIEEAFDASYRDRGIFVFEMHYHRFAEPSDRAALRDLIEYVRSRDRVKFMTIGGVARAIEEDRLRREDDGWVLNETQYGNPTG